MTPVKITIDNTLRGFKVENWSDFTEIVNNSW